MGRLARAVNELETAALVGERANTENSDEVIDAMFGLINAARDVIDNWDNG